MSSALTTSTSFSCCSAALVFSESPSSAVTAAVPDASSSPDNAGPPAAPSLAIVPLCEIFGHGGGRGVFVEEEVEQSAEEGVPVGAAVEFGDALEGERPPDDAENIPEVRQRLRTFHIV